MNSVTEGPSLLTNLAAESSLDDIPSTEARQPMATCSLAAHHHQMLTVDSHISMEVIAARGYTTVYEPEELQKMGFYKDQLRVPALVIPIFDVFGELRFHRIRPDDPRPDAAKPHKVVKYDQPLHTPLVIDVPPASFEKLKD